jgi:TRAP-type mannitol/chloroaromatic compound transport system substrate-binding protein
MKRRKFMTGAAAAGVTAAGLASTLSKPAIAQDVTELSFTTPWPAGLPGLATAVDRIAADVEAMSGGSLKLQIFRAGELNPSTQILETIQSGGSDTGLDPSYWHVGITNDLGFFTAVPFGLTATEHNAWIQFGGGQELWDEVYRDFGQKALLAGNTANQTMGWFKQPLTSVADLDGLKFRIPGFGGQVMAKFGVVPQTLGPGDTTAALEAGTIDGGEFVGPMLDEIIGFYRVAPVMHWPGFHEPGAALGFYTALPVWEGLSSEHKAIVSAATLAANDSTPAEINAGSIPALRRLIQDHGVQTVQLPDDVLQAFVNGSGELMQEIIEAGSERTRRIADSWLKFRKDAITWMQISDQGFTNARVLDYQYPDGI